MKEKQLKELFKRIGRLSFLPEKADHDECVDIFVQGAMVGYNKRIKEEQEQHKNNENTIQNPNK